MTDICLSIVTASRNRRPLLERLGRSLSAKCKWEWLVADSSDEPIAFMPGANIIRAWPPEGVTHALALLFPKCQGKYVALLHDDIEPDPGTLDKAIEFMDLHPEVGQGAFYTRTPSHGCHIPPWGGWMYAKYWIVRREMGNAVGWQDLSFWHCGSDNDFSARMLEAGYGVVAIPGACVVDHAYQDQAHEMAMKTSHERKDTERMENLWKPHQPRLKQLWEEKWKSISGPYECTRAH